MSASLSSPPSPAACSSSCSPPSLPVKGSFPPHPLHTSSLTLIARARQHPAIWTLHARDPHAHPGTSTSTENTDDDRSDRLVALHRNRTTREGIGILEIGPEGTPKMKTNVKGKPEFAFLSVRRTTPKHELEGGERAEPSRESTKPEMLSRIHRQLYYAVPPAFSYAHSSPKAMRVSVTGAYPWWSIFIEPFIVDNTTCDSLSLRKKYPNRDGIDWLNQPHSSVSTSEQTGFCLALICFEVLQARAKTEITKYYYQGMFLVSRATDATRRCTQTSREGCKSVLTQCKPIWQALAAALSNDCIKVTFSDDIRLEISTTTAGGPEHVRIAFYPCLDQNSTGAASSLALVTDASSEELQESAQQELEKRVFHAGDQVETLTHLRIALSVARDLVPSAHSGARSSFVILDTFIAGYRSHRIPEEFSNLVCVAGPCSVPRPQHTTLLRKTSVGVSVLLQLHKSEPLCRPELCDTLGIDFSFPILLDFRPQAVTLHVKEAGQQRKLVRSFIQECVLAFFRSIVSPQRPSASNPLAPVNTEGTLNPGPSPGSSSSSIASIVTPVTTAAEWTVAPPASLAPTPLMTAASPSPSDVVTRTVEFLMDHLSNLDKKCVVCGSAIRVSDHATTGTSNAETRPDDKKAPSNFVLRSCTSPSCSFTHRHVKLASLGVVSQPQPQPEANQDSWSSHQPDPTSQQGDSSLGSQSVNSGSNSGDDQTERASKRDTGPIHTTFALRVRLALSATRAIIKGSRSADVVFPHRPRISLEHGESKRHKVNHIEDASTIDSGARGLWSGFHDAPAQRAEYDFPRLDQLLSELNTSASMTRTALARRCEGGSYSGKVERRGESRPAEGENVGCEDRNGKRKRVEKEEENEEGAVSTEAKAVAGWLQAPPLPKLAALEGAQRFPAFEHAGSVPTLQVRVEGADTAAEAAFMARCNAEGSFFAFHGSPLQHWHSILCSGLKVFSGTRNQVNGAAFGNGIYLSTSASKSLSYCVPRAFRRRRRGMQDDYDGPAPKVLAMCQVVGTPELYKPKERRPCLSPDILVASDPDMVRVRFLVVFQPQPEPPAHSQADPTTQVPTTAQATASTTVGAGGSAVGMTAMSRRALPEPRKRNRRAWLLNAAGLGPSLAAQVEGTVSCCGSPSSVDAHARTLLDLPASEPDAPDSRTPGRPMLGGNRAAMDTDQHACNTTPSTAMPSASGQDQTQLALEAVPAQAGSSSGHRDASHCDWRSVTFRQTIDHWRSSHLSQFWEQKQLGAQTSREQTRGKGAEPEHQVAVCESNGGSSLSTDTVRRGDSGHLPDGSRSSRSSSSSSPREGDSDESADVSRERVTGADAPAATPQAPPALDTRMSVDSEGASDWTDPLRQVWTQPDLSSGFYDIEDGVFQGWQETPPGEEEATSGGHVDAELQLWLATSESCHGSKTRE